MWLAWVHTTVGSEIKSMLAQRPDIFVVGASVDFICLIDGRAVEWSIDSSCESSGLIYALHVIFSILLNLKSNFQDPALSSEFIANLFRDM
jgi:hypothetical protein